MYVIRLRNEMGPDRYPVWAKYIDNDNTEVIWYHTTTRPEYPLINNILKFNSEKEAREWWNINKINVKNSMWEDTSCELDYDDPIIIYFDDDDEEDFEDYVYYAYGVTHEKYIITTFHGDVLCRQDVYHNEDYDNYADDWYYLRKGIENINHTSLFNSYDAAEKYCKDNIDSIINCIGEKHRFDLYITRLAINVFAYEPSTEVDVADV